MSSLALSHTLYFRVRLGRNQTLVYFHVELADYRRSNPSNASSNHSQSSQTQSNEHAGGNTAGQTSEIGHRRSRLQTRTELATLSIDPVDDVAARPPAGGQSIFYLPIDNEALGGQWKYPFLSSSHSHSAKLMARADTHDVFFFLVFTLVRLYKNKKQPDYALGGNGFMFQSRRRISIGDTEPFPSEIASSVRRRACRRTWPALRSSR